MKPKIYEVTFSYTHYLEAKNKEEAEIKGMEAMDEDMPRTDEMNVKVIKSKVQSL